MKVIKNITCACLFVITTAQVSGQRVSEQGLFPASQNFKPGRFNLVVICEGTFATLATIGFKYLWYKKFPKSKFHFFNDNNEWLNMDKVGHAASAYNIAAIQYNLMRWSGVKQNSSIYIAGGTALAYMSLIEIFDGFSAEWGFSKGDMLANIIGSSIFVAQQSAWHQQRIQLRFSYHNTIFQKYNPGMLGRNLPQRIFKDYNGQSYWLSFNIASFGIGNNTPKWLNADIGYGADGMTGAVTNPTMVKGVAVPSFLRQRKLLFSVNGAFTSRQELPFPSWMNIFRVPVPALEYKLKSKELKAFAIYY